MKMGKVVIVLNGRFAGRKAVVLKVHEQGNGSRKFSHALIAGVAKYPRKTTKGMSKKKIAKKIAMKTFVRHVNLNHLFPTRYNVDFSTKLKDLDFAGIEKTFDIDVKKKRETCKNSVRKIFENR